MPNTAAATTGTDIHTSNTNYSTNSSLQTGEGTVDKKGIVVHDAN